MNSTQDRPRPGAGDICPDLGGPAITGPLEITWAEGLEELRNIRQATDRCAGYLMDIRHILGQIASTSGQMADAMQRIHDGMDHLQGDIASAADTIPYIADCVCRGLSTQIEAADRPPLTWEGQWSQAVDTYRPTEGIAAILAPIYIRRMEITYAGYIPQVMGEICACRRLQEWPWWKYIRNVWPTMETGGTQAYIMLQPGLQTIIDNITIYMDQNDEHVGWRADIPVLTDNLYYHIRITYDRLDGSRQQALKHVG